jgi:hypothetical protein
LAVLDRYLEAMSKQRAEALIFRSGAPVEMVTAGSSRTVSSSLQAAPGGSLIARVEPAAAEEGEVGTHTRGFAASTVDRLIDQFPADRQPQVRTMLSETLDDAVIDLVKAGAVEPQEAYDRAISKKEMGLLLTRSGFKGGWSEERA